ncbi:hypothetical protein D3C71_2165250 [compost metagenome]
MQEAPVPYLLQELLQQLARSGNHPLRLTGIQIALKDDLLLGFINGFHLHQVYDKCPVTPEQPRVFSLDIL